MIPIFEDGVKAALVERVNIPGALGVAVRGGKFVCPLPLGYDDRTSIAEHLGYILVAHPDLPPLRCDPTTGQTVLIDDKHVSAQPGRIRLNTK